MRKKRKDYKKYQLIYLKNNLNILVICAKGIIY